MVKNASKAQEDKNKVNETPKKKYALTDKRFDESDFTKKVLDGSIRGISRKPKGKELFKRHDCKNTLIKAIEVFIKAEKFGTPISLSGVTDIIHGDVYTNGKMTSPDKDKAIEDIFNDSDYLNDLKERGYTLETNRGKSVELENGIWSYTPYEKVKGERIGATITIHDVDFERDLEAEKADKEFDESFNQ